MDYIIIYVTDLIIWIADVLVSTPKILCTRLKVRHLIKKISQKIRNLNIWCYFFLH